MPLPRVAAKLRIYWSMTKSLQTSLLVVTGIAGYSSARCPVMTWATVFALAASLFMVISGSTVFNMICDRDIDAAMKRTCWRPLPAEAIRLAEALLLGIGLSALGLALAWRMNAGYGVVVGAGLVIDVLIYTMWLKRRTPYSIVFGGLAGGMPVLAGRVLGTGQIDLIGILLALAVLFWIPTHIMTFSIRYDEDYRRAGVPTFPSTYGIPATRLLISLSSIGATALVTAAAVGIGMSWGYIGMLALLGFVLLGFAVLNIVRSSARSNLGLFKFASLYMLITMLLVVIGGL